MDIKPIHIILFLGVLAGMALFVKLFASFVDKRENENMKYSPLIRESAKILQVEKMDVLNVRQAKVLVEDETGNRHMLLYKGEATFIAGDEGMIARQGKYLVSFQSKQ